MRDNCNWKCEICGWEMFIDPEILIGGTEESSTNRHVIRCGKCGSMFKSRD